LLTHRYDDALVRAHAWQRSQKRKGTPVPYVAHLLAVSALVLEHGGTEDEAIAALFHDALEDAPNQEEANARRSEIRHRFGDAVLQVVAACTDAEPDGKGAERKLDEEGRREAWMARKTAYVAHLEHTFASVLLVAAADKVHNAAAIVRDVGTHGPEVFMRFVGRADGTLWYYREVHTALQARAPEEPRVGVLVAELGRLVREMGEAERR
jgi:(p)ppGpp synthase/HD superfamily hydrolase